MHGTDLPERPAERGATGSPGGFEVITQRGPSGTELVLIGELDQATRPIFDAAVAAALRDAALREGAPVLVLELSGLDFLAVAGARAFERIHERCARGGGRLVLVAPRRQIRRLLTLFELAHLVREP